MAVNNRNGTMETFISNVTRATRTTTTEFYSSNGGDPGDEENNNRNGSSVAFIIPLIGSDAANWTTSADMQTFATPYPSDTTTEEQVALERQVTQFWIGVALSVSSSVFIGLSFIIKKKALIRLSKGGRRANQGGYGYLKDLLWWSGLLSMAVGEAANFMAYTFAPASLVSTLGVLSVLVTAILSSKLLNERLNFLGKIGCFLSAIGSTVIVLHAPMEKDIESMLDLEQKLTNLVFVMYVVGTIVASVVLIYHYRPRLPETSTYTLLIWIGVCSMIGSLSVMSVKGLGLALMNTVTGTENELDNWLTWFCLLTLVICVSVQMNFLNKALDTFNTAVVTPIYYVFFTSCVIVASALLFNEFDHLPVKDWMGLACGFFTVITSIMMLHLCKNFEVTLATLAQQLEVVNSGSHEPVKGDSLTLSLEVKQRRGRSRAEGGAGGDPECSSSGGSDGEEEIYRSVDSCNSGRCSQPKGSSGVGLDSRLLSSSYSPKGGTRGYMPLSYGTTDI